MGCLARTLLWISGSTLSHWQIQSQVCSHSAPMQGPVVSEEKGGVRGVVGTVSPDLQGSYYPHRAP